MTWILTGSGVCFPLASPRPEDVNGVDIAHALSRQQRFTGHTSRPWTVAQHSLLVMSLAPRHVALAALLHDAHEAYIGDISTPLKQRMTQVAGRDVVKELEAPIIAAIARRFSLAESAEVAALVKEADLDALHLERCAFLPPSGPEWAPLVGRSSPDATDVFRAIEEARDGGRWDFLDALYKLAPAP